MIIPNMEALIAGPEDGHVDIEKFLTMSAYEIARYYPSFFKTVFNRESSLNMFNVSLKEAWPVHIPSGFLRSKVDSGSFGTDFWGHSYVRLASKKFIPYTLSDISSHRKDLLSLREVFVLILLIFWLTGKETVKKEYAKKVFLTNCLGSVDHLAGVYVKEDGSVEISLNALKLIKSGYDGFLIKEVPS